MQFFVTDVEIGTEMVSPIGAIVHFECDEQFAIEFNIFLLYLKFLYTYLKPLILN